MDGRKRYKKHMPCVRIYINRLLLFTLPIFRIFCVGTKKEHPVPVCAYECHSHILLSSVRDLVHVYCLCCVHVPRATIKSIPQNISTSFGLQFMTKSRSIFRSMRRYQCEGKNVCKAVNSQRLLHKVIQMDKIIIVQYIRSTKKSTKKSWFFSQYHVFISGAC